MYICIHVYIHIFSRFFIFSTISYLADSHLNFFTFIWFFMIHSLNRFVTSCCHQASDKAIIYKNHFRYKVKVLSYQEALRGKAKSSMRILLR